MWFDDIVKKGVIMGDFVFNVEQQPLPKNLSNVTHAEKLIDKVAYLF